MKTFYLVMFVVVTLFVTGDGFNPDSYSPSRLEVDKAVTRQEYYGPELGKIYKNRFGVTYFNKVYPKMIKFESVFFTSLGNPIVFLPLYAVLAYLGYKKYS